MLTFMQTSATKSARMRKKPWSAKILKLAQICQVRTYLVQTRVHCLLSFGLILDVKVKLLHDLPIVRNSRIKGAQLK
jgi:hypothetical protein